MLRRFEYLVLSSIILVLFILATLFNKDMFYTSTSDSLYKPNIVNEQREKLEKLSNVNFKKTSTSKKVTCRSRPEYVNHDIIELDPKIIDDVETMIMFIGYPRSGHSLIGSILDAHPNMVIANEYNILDKWANFTTKLRKKKNLFDQLYTNSYIEASKGDRSSEVCLPKTKYNYLIPNQWQGKFDGKIKAIGDKKGGATTKLFNLSKEYLTILQEIRQEVKVPIKFIHVIRNPFDNIATIILRARFDYNLNWTEIYKSPMNVSKTKLIKYIHYHMKFALTNARLIRMFADKVYTVRSEDFISNPGLELRKICNFLDVQCTTKYISDCSRIVKSKISRSRNGIIWDEEAKNMMFLYIKHIAFYRDYKFHE